MTDYQVKQVAYAERRANSFLKGYKDSRYSIELTAKDTERGWIKAAVTAHKGKAVAGVVIEQSGNANDFYNAVIYWFTETKPELDAQYEALPEEDKVQVKVNVVTTNLKATEGYTDSYDLAKAVHQRLSRFPTLYGHPSHEYGLQEKLDGERIKCDTRDGIKYTSRRVSTVTNEVRDKTECVPHMLSGIPANCIFDGEMKMPNSDDLGLTVGALSSPRRAAEITAEHGPIHYYIFDMLNEDGEDIRKLPYSERYRRLTEKFKQFNNPCAHLVELYLFDTPEEGKALRDSIWEAGREGLIAKKMSAAYGTTNSMIKIKATRTWDAFITNEFVQGEGKYEGQIGSILVKCIDRATGQPRELCYVVPGDDALRRDMTDHLDKYVGRVVEIEGQQATKNGRVRHPRIKRWRDDKDWSACIEDFDV